MGFSCAAASIAGTVIAIYSTVHLCQKIMDENTSKKALLVTTLGGFATAAAQTINQHLWKLAPDFGHPGMHSMAYCIATNFAWHLSLITGMAGVVFTAYPAYRTGAVIYQSSVAPKYTQSDSKLGR